MRQSGTYLASIFPPVGIVLQQRVREQHTQEFQRWVSGCVVLEALSSRARFIFTTVVQIGVAIVFDPYTHDN